jgi:hypothetical protein
VECAPTAWNDVTIQCTAPLLTAGLWPIRVLDANGQFSNTLSISIELIISTASLGGASVSATDGSTLNSGFGGGLPLTLRGSGLGDASQVSVKVCGEECAITHSNTTTTICTTPSITTAEGIEALPGAYKIENIADSADTDQFHTDWSVLSNVQNRHTDVAAEKAMAAAVFLSRVDEAVRLEPGRDMDTRRACSFAFDLAPHQLGLVSSVALFPPTKDSDRPYARHIVFQVKSLQTGAWLTIANLENAVDTGVAMQQGWNEVEVDDVKARQFRLFLPGAVGCNAGRELLRGARFRGYVVNSLGENGTCPIALQRVVHPLAYSSAAIPPLAARISHSVDRTPVITSISPKYGTARGGTLVQLAGNHLDTEPGLGTTITVSFNGYDCTDAASNSVTQLSCLTGARSGAIMRKATRAWVPGKGNALIIPDNGGSTSWEYLLSRGL